MVGRVIDRPLSRQAARRRRAGELILDGARADRAAGGSATSRFELREGEILGLAGLIGAGRSEIVKGICGLEGAVPATSIADGAGVAASATTCRQHRARASSTCREDRKGDGVFLDMSIAANISALDV